MFYKKMNTQDHKEKLYKGWTLKSESEVEWKTFCRRWRRGGSWISRLWGSRSVRPREFPRWAADPLDPGSSCSTYTCCPRLPRCPPLPDRGAAQTHGAEQTARPGEETRSPSAANRWENKLIQEVMRAKFSQSPNKMHQNSTNDVSTNRL